MATKVLLFSGGLDSTTLLWKLKQDVKCISFNYAQRHNKELDAADEICRNFSIEHKIVQLAQGNEFGVSVAELIKIGSQTSSEPVPEGHYTHESMKKTIVPNRNMIMLAIATGWAVATGAREVYWAAHAG